MGRACLAFILGTALLAALLSLISASGGIITPPAVLPALDPEWSITEGAYPRGTRSVEVPLGAGEYLRGIYVPSDTTAPLVVHLAESGTSVTTLTGRRYPVDQLSDLGFASLFIDYRGVGLSDGERSPDSVAADARSIYDFARVLVGGDEDRLVLRATSLGTLGASALLEDGASPAAVILYAPILGDTVALRMGQARFPAWVAWIAASPLRAVTEADLVDALEARGDRVLVFTPEFDELLSTTERQLIRQTTLDAGGQVVTSPITPMVPVLMGESGPLPLAGHLAAAREASELQQEEREFLQRQFPATPDVPGRVATILSLAAPELTDTLALRPRATQRLARLAADHLNAPPDALVALALQIEDVALASELMAEDLRWGARGVFGDLTASELMLNLDLADPAGALPATALLEAKRTLRRLIKHRAGPDWPIVDTRSLALLLCSPESEEFALRIRMHIPRGRRERRAEILAMKLGEGAAVFTPTGRGQILWEYVAEGGSDYRAATFRSAELRASIDRDASLVPSEQARRIQRILMKAVGYTERAVLAEDGSTQIEVLQEGVWALTAPHPSAR